MQGVQVQTLVRKLRSHMSHGQKKKKKTQNIKQKQYCNKFNKDLEKKKKEIMSDLWTISDESKPENIF